jgi:hypothetical protein
MSTEDKRPTTTKSEVESLGKAVQTLKAYTGLVLRSLAKHGEGTRDKTIGNFVARGMTCTESILLVWKEENEQDAWILHRALIDRLFHLHYLVETDSFTAFEETCFVKTYEMRQKILDDPTLRDGTLRNLELHESQKQRYTELSSKRPVWRPPSARVVASHMKLDFLYSVGYEYASTHVHPSAHDGEDDFRRMTKLQGRRSYPDATVVKNSVLVQSILLGESLRATSVTWRVIVYRFLTELANHIRDHNDREFQKTFDRIARTWPVMDLCRPRKRH